MRFGHSWLILQTAEKPCDLRIKKSKKRGDKLNDTPDEISRSLIFFRYSRLCILPHAFMCVPHGNVDAASAFLPQQMQGI